MSKHKQPKLVTPGKVVLIVAAIMVGGSMPLVRQYNQEGKISSTNLIASLVAVGVGAVIAIIVIWWANRPEDPE